MVSTIINNCKDSWCCARVQLTKQGHSIHIHTWTCVYMYIWNMEKFSEKAFFIIKLGLLIHYSHFIGVLVLVFPLSIYYLVILLASLAFFSRKLVHLAKRWVKWKKSNQNQKYCIFLHINLLKMSCRKCWKWYFQDPKVKNFLGEYALGWDTVATTFHLHVCTHSKSHAMRLKRLIRHKRGPT